MYDSLLIIWGYDLTSAGNLLSNVINRYFYSSIKMMIYREITPVSADLQIINISSNLKIFVDTLLIFCYH